MRSIERIAPEIERELIALKPNPKRFLWGLFADLGTAPSAADIDLARREEWVNFLAEDF